MWPRTRLAVARCREKLAHNRAADARPLEAVRFRWDDTDVTLLLETIDRLERAVREGRAAVDAAPEPWRAETRAALSVED